MDLPSAVDNLTSPLDGQDAFDHEGRVLSFLRLIRHPSIVRLIGSYSYRNTYNLLFECAEHDLGDLLSRKQRPPALQTDDAFFQAMQGLCEALASFHRLTHPDYKLEMKGYHHDLKPENILVDGPRLLLSDFGLSSLKDMKAKSKTLSKGVIGYYVAPECEDVEDGFERKMIGQPSDIWALGCILAVILTYIRRGVDGVDEFERRRQHKSNNWTRYTFHSAGAANPAINEWLTELEYDASPEAVDLVELIRKILRIDPGERPLASAVSSSMEFLAAKSMYRVTMEQFDQSKRRLDDSLFSLERDRFDLFGQALGLANPGCEWQSMPGIPTGRVDFKVFRGLLLDLQQTLSLPFPISFQYSATSRVREGVDKLWELLPPSVRSKLTHTIETRIVSTVDLAVLDAVQDRFKDKVAYRNIGLIAAMKSMIILADQGKLEAPELELKSELVVSIDTEIGPFSSRAQVEDPDTRERKHVLIEWLEYDARWRESAGKELFLRVQGIANVLHDKHKSKMLRSLRCWKFYHSISRHSFGLIFDIPAQQDQPVTLADLIRRTRNLRQRPDLGKLFGLSRVLAASVLEWHKLGWLHRRISSFSILFFLSDSDSPFASITDPAFLGFQFGRRNESNGFTTGPPTQEDLRDYCHPDYLRDDTDYRGEFDYYSLGLVLLELGYWKPLASLIQNFRDEDQSPENLRTWLLENSVSELHMVMGGIYQEVVRTCLTFQGDESLVQDHLIPPEVLEKFGEEVLLRLGMCCA